MQFRKIIQTLSVLINKKLTLTLTLVHHKMKNECLQYHALILSQQTKYAKGNKIRSKTIPYKITFSGFE